MTDAGQVMRGEVAELAALAASWSAGGSRQGWVEVVFHQGTRAAGSLLCREGVVHDATAEPDLRGRPALEALLRRPGSRFTAYHRPAPLEVGPALGRLDELLAPPGSGGSRSDPPVVLEGTFGEFGVREVLDVMSFSRSPLALTCTRADGTQVTLVTRSGRVLRCDDPSVGRQGREALAELLRRPGLVFRVVPAPEPSTDGAPIASLAELLAEPRGREGGGSALDRSGPTSVLTPRPRSASGSEPRSAPATSPSAAPPASQEMAEVAAALRGLERAISRPGSAVARAELAFLAVVLLQITTLLAAVAALGVRLLSEVGG